MHERHMSKASACELYQTNMTNNFIVNDSSFPGGGKVFFRTFLAVAYFSYPVGKL